MNPFCICDCDIENTRHFSSKITNDDSNILNQADASITKTLLFCNSNYSSRVNSQILNANIDFILRSKRFDELSKCPCLSVSPIKTICQFEYKVRVIFILIFTLFQIVLVFLYSGTGNTQYIGNTVKGRISKLAFQENKARQIFRKMNISYPLIRTCVVFLKHLFLDSYFCLITEE